MATVDDREHEEHAGHDVRGNGKPEGPHVEQWIAVVIIRIVVVAKNDDIACK